MNVYDKNLFFKLLSGTTVTLELTLLSLLVGLIFAMTMTSFLQSRHWYLKAPIKLYIFLVRGTPMLLQFFIIYYGSAQLSWLRISPLWVIFKEPFFCAILALAINTSAYSTVLFTGAINSVPKGEKDACWALGFSHFQAMRYVVLPRAIRIALPAYSNEVIMVLKGTSLASTITVLELTGVSHQLASQTYLFIQFFFIAGLIYLAISVTIISIFKEVEKKITF